MARALVVDPSKTVRSLICSMLRDLRVDFDEAESAELALARAPKGAFDVIFLEWKMSDLSGLECLDRLRSDPITNGVKIVMVTSNGDLNRISEALDRGADEYLMKPFDRTIVEWKLESLGLIAQRTDDVLERLENVSE